MDSCVRNQWWGLSPVYQRADYQHASPARVASQLWAAVPFFKSIIILLCWSTGGQGGSADVEQGSKKKKSILWTSPFSEVLFVYVVVAARIYDFYTYVHTVEKEAQRRVPAAWSPDCCIV